MAKLTYHVFFEGTDGYARSKRSLTSFLHEIVVADGKISFKAIYDGCGTQHAHAHSIDSNGLFTHGLTSQVDHFIKQIRNKLINDLDAEMVINPVGFSRGGAAVFLLAERIHQLPKAMLNRITMNLGAFEPVPGNFIASAQTDTCNSTLTSNISDLSDCTQVIKMLAIYTNELLPHDGALLNKAVSNAHAPILPKYDPDTCAVEVDVISGCHKTAQALVMQGNDILFYDRSSFITFCRFKDFLESAGARFNLDRKRFYNIDGKIEFFDEPGFIGLYYQELLTELKNNYHHLFNVKPELPHLVRPMHNGNNILTNREAAYLNAHHKLLVNPAGIDDVSDVALRVEKVKCEPKLKSSACFVM